MCGLALLPAGSGQYERMKTILKRMGYRGPDATQIVEHDGWLMGHVRLAIQNLGPSGAQPFPVKGGMMMFVGEFFGLNGQTEIEFLQQMVEEGRFPEGLHEVDGFWSIVAVLHGEAFAYTDHLGIKPLYYGPFAQAICSEPAPLAEALYLPFSDYYRWSVTQTGKPAKPYLTPWGDLVHVPPGCLFRVDGLVLDYWDWGKVPAPEPTAQNLRQELVKSVTNRASDSEVPVCMLLSGGLDSSFLYAICRTYGLPVKPFSVENGETEYLPNDPDLEFLDFAEPDLGTLVNAFQGPMDLGSLGPQYQLAEAVGRQGYRVCLTGDGADELFGGYRRAAERDTQDYDVNYELPVWHLPRLDRLHMRFGTEIRSPFLSPRIAKMALQLPWEQRRSKELVKEAARGLVPDNIIDRPKKPLKVSKLYTTPTEYWGELRGAFYDT